MEMGTEENTFAQISVVIQPRKGLLQLEFEELWRYRELLWFLVWRDVLIRYKQTVIGISW